MAHFRAVIKGQRGEASRLGSARTGIRATVDGWEGGVRVVAIASDAGDIFEIYATCGSNAYSSGDYIGHVVNGVFIPNVEV